MEIRRRTLIAQRPGLDQLRGYLCRLPRADRHRSRLRSVGAQHFRIGILHAFRIVEGIQEIVARREAVGIDLREGWPGRRCRKAVVAAPRRPRAGTSSAIPEPVDLAPSTVAFSVPPSLRSVSSNVQEVPAVTTRSSREQVGVAALRRLHVPASIGRELRGVTSRLNRAQAQGAIALRAAVDRISVRHTRIRWRSGVRRPAANHSRPRAGTKAARPCGLA